MNPPASSRSTAPVALLLAGLLVAALSCASGGSKRAGGEERAAGGSRLLAKAARVAVAVAVDDEEVGIGTLTSAMRSDGDEDESLASVLTRAAVDVATDGDAEGGGDAEFYRDLVVGAAGGGSGDGSSASKDEIARKAVELVANRAGGNTGDATLELLGHAQGSADGDGRGKAYDGDAAERDLGGLVRFAGAGGSIRSDDLVDADDLSRYRGDAYDSSSPEGTTDAPAYGADAEELERPEPDEVSWGPGMEDAEDDGLDRDGSAPVGSPFRKKGSKLSKAPSTASVPDEPADPDPSFDASSDLDDVPYDDGSLRPSHTDPRGAQEVETPLLSSAGASHGRPPREMTLLGAVAQGAAPGPEVDYRRIVNRSQQVLHIETGSLEAGVALPEWKSADWILEPVSDGIHVRIRNRWRPDVYLHAERGVLEAGPIQTAWRSAQWVLVPLAGTRFQRIRNGWHRELYIHTEGGPVAAGPVDPAVASAQWTLEPARLSIDVAASGDAGSGEKVHGLAEELLVCETVADCTMISRCPERAVHVSDPAVEEWQSFAAGVRFAPCRDSYPHTAPACQQGLCIAVPHP